MTDVLAEAVAKAEAELAAEKQTVFVLARVQQGSMHVSVLGATHDVQDAMKLAEKSAKTTLTWDAAIRVLASQKVRVVIKHEYVDVTYNIIETTLT